MQHGWMRKFDEVAKNPKGRRSYDGKPKLGGAPGILENDSDLRDVLKRIKPNSSETLTDIGKRLKKMKPKKWCVQKGKRKGTAWSAKQIATFMRFRKKK